VLGEAERAGLIVDPKEQDQKGGFHSRRLRRLWKSSGFHPLDLEPEVAPTGIHFG
jgi:hypothetical protein